MSPRPADPKVRMALIETAAAMIAAEGPARLSLRKLATAVGTSTMAVYTHFGGMDELRREVRREGFARLYERVAAVPPTDDPVADLALVGQAYYANAVANPNLYRAMFMEGPIGPDDAGIGRDAFDQLVEAVQRCVEAGRFAGDPTAMALQIWAMAHGVVALELAHMLAPDVARSTLQAAGANLFRSFAAGASLPRQ